MDASPPCTVLFVRSDVEVEARVGENLLDVADRAGVRIDSVCRGGTCGTCRVMLRSGAPELDDTKALSGKQRRAGWILACSAYVQPGRTIVDA